MVDWFPWRQKKQEESPFVDDAPSEEEESVPAVAQVVAQPPVLNPDADERLKFAAWRAGHIQRWLDDPSNADAAPEKRHYLTAERDMHQQVLRTEGQRR